MSYRHQRERRDKVPMALLTRDNPRRPVNWRWIRAKQLHDARSLLARFEDPLVKFVVKYLNMKKTGCDSEELALTYPEIYEVDQLSSDAGMERWMLEGLILADAPYDVLYDKFGIAETNIQLYEQLLFDVRDRLPRQGFIFSQVIGAAVNGEFDDYDQDKWYKLLGYHGYLNKLGGALLEAEWALGSLDPEVKLWYIEMVDSKILKRTAKTLSSRRANPEVAGFIASNYWESRKFDQANKNSPDKSRSRDANNKLLEALSMSVAKVSDITTEHEHERSSEQLSRQLKEIGLGLPDNSE